MTQFIVGTLLLGVCLSYGLWCYARIVLLREDLFEIRDELFDRARSLHALDDDGYRAARDAINGCIRFAHLWSWPTLVYGAVRHPPYQVRTPSANPAVQEEIIKAVTAVHTRMARYLLRETVCGWILSSLLIVLAPWLEFRSFFREQVGQVVDKASGGDDGLAFG